MDKNKDTKSKTETKLSFIDAITGIGPHYLTTISDGDKTVEGKGYSSEKSQERASEKWDKEK